MIIDHVAIVVDSIEAAAEYYTRTFGLKPLGDPVVDPLQDVQVLFLEDDRGARVELIQPSSDGSPVARALKTGGGLNHLCYQVENLDDAVRQFVASGAKLAREPRPAIAFGGRRVAFLYTRRRELVEFVEIDRG